MGESSSHWAFSPARATIAPNCPNFFSRPQTPQTGRFSVIGRQDTPYKAPKSPSAPGTTLRG